MTRLNMAEQDLLDLAVRARALWEDDGTDAHYPNFGISVFVTGLCDILYNLMPGIAPLYADGSRHWEAKRAVFMQWPEFSGNPDYPVSHPDYPGDPYRGFESTGGKGFWTGEYGAARLRLLQFVIDYLTDKAGAARLRLLD